MSISAAAASIFLIGGVALGASPIAAAASTKPKPMHITASGGDHTSIDSDGTQGSFTDAVEGKVDTDGDQDAFDLTRSEEAAPQDKAPNKMTK